MFPFNSSYFDILFFGYNLIAVPPDIIEDETSSNIITKENQSIELRCKATGFPAPRIAWLREDGGLIRLGNKFGKYSCCFLHNEILRLRIIC